MEKKYIVKLINVFSNLIAVDANNEEEAKEKAKELIVNKPTAWVPAPTKASVLRRVRTPVRAINY